MAANPSKGYKDVTDAATAEATAAEAAAPQGDVPPEEQMAAPAVTPEMLMEHIVGIEEILIQQGLAQPSDFAPVGAPVPSGEMGAPAPAGTPPEAPQGY